MFTKDQFIKMMESKENFKNKKEWEYQAIIYNVDSNGKALFLTINELLSLLPA